MTSHASDPANGACIEAEVRQPGIVRSKMPLLIELRLRMQTVPE